MFQFFHVVPKNMLRLKGLSLFETNSKKKGRQGHGGCQGKPCLHAGNWIG